MPGLESGFSVTWPVTSAVTEGRPGLWFKRWRDPFLVTYWQFVDSVRLPVVACCRQSSSSGTVVYTRISVWSSRWHVFVVIEEHSIKWRFGTINTAWITTNWRWKRVLVRQSQNLGTGMYCMGSIHLLPMCLFSNIVDFVGHLVWIRRNSCPASKQEWTTLVLFHLEIMMKVWLVDSVIAIGLLFIVSKLWK